LPRSEKSLLREQIASLLRRDDRYIDLGAQLRVWRCPCGIPHREWPAGKPHDFAAEPAELLPTVYGGRYDRLLRKYVGEPKVIREIACHEGQIPVLTFDEPGVLRVLALGSPGAGKTFAAVRRALLMGIARPNSVGGLIAPTNDRRQILWRDFLEACPPEWLEDVKTSKKEIVLANRTVIQVLAARASSAQYGSPLQGRSFDWAVVDESQNVTDEGHAEIATRGRRAGKRYIIFETATNAQVPAFRVRLESFKTAPDRRRINFTGFQNPWVEPDYWLRMKGDLSERDYREKILAEDVPPERLLYPRFDFAKTVVPRGQVPAFATTDVERQFYSGLRDVTEEITLKLYDRPCKFIVGQDFGVLVNASVILKCYQNRLGERLWWAIDEITSNGETDIHARKILRFYNPAEIVVVADPHFNTKEADKSDYNIFKNAHLDTKPATHGRITVEHRISMMNALLEDAVGRRRFFIDCDANRQPKCKYLVQSLLISQRNEHGEPEKDRKSGITDPSHWTSAVQYGMYPWEQIRAQGQAQPTVRQMTAAQQREAELRRQQRFYNR